MKEAMTGVGNGGGFGWRRALGSAAPFALPLLVVVVVIAAIFRGASTVASAGPERGSGAGVSERLEAGNGTNPRKGVTVSLGEVFFIQRHPATREVEWLGSAIVWLLLVLSMVSLALMGSFAWENRREAISPGDLFVRARSLLRENRLEEALELARARPSFLGEILIAGLGESGAGRVAMARASAQASEERTVHRLRRLEPLNIIGNVSPMIGLFGTVYGMILAFREIVAAGGTPDPVGLAAGIGTALVTTFWGLVVAIPALAVFAVLRNRLDEMTTLATRHAEDMFNHCPVEGTGRGRGGGV